MEKENKIEQTVLLINSLTLLAIKGTLNNDLSINSKTDIIEQIIEDRNKILILTDIRENIK